MGIFDKFGKKKKEDQKQSFDPVSYMKNEINTSDKQGHDGFGDSGNFDPNHNDMLVSFDDSKPQPKSKGSEFPKMDLPPPPSMGKSSDGSSTQLPVFNTEQFSESPPSTFDNSPGHTPSAFPSDVDHKDFAVQSKNNANAQPSKPSPQTPPPLTGQPSKPPAGPGPSSQTPPPLAGQPSKPPAGPGPSSQTPPPLTGQPSKPPAGPGPNSQTPPLKQVEKPQEKTANQPQTFQNQKPSQGQPASAQPTQQNQMQQPQQNAAMQQSASQSEQSSSLKGNEGLQGVPLSQKPQFPKPAFYQEGAKVSGSKEATEQSNEAQAQGTIKEETKAHAPSGLGKLKDELSEKLGFHTKTQKPFPQQPSAPPGKESTVQQTGAPQGTQSASEQQEQTKTDYSSQVSKQGAPLQSQGSQGPAPEQYQQPIQSQENSQNQAAVQPSSQTQPAQPQESQSNYPGQSSGLQPSVQAQAGPQSQEFQSNYPDQSPGVQPSGQAQAMPQPQESQTNYPGQSPGLQPSGQAQAMPQPQESQTNYPGQSSGVQPSGQAQAMPQPQESQTNYPGQSSGVQPAGQMQAGPQTSQQTQDTFNYQQPTQPQMQTVQQETQPEQSTPTEVSAQFTGTQGANIKESLHEEEIFISVSDLRKLVEIVSAVDSEVKVASDSVTRTEEISDDSEGLFESLRGQLESVQEFVDKFDSIMFKE